MMRIILLILFSLTLFACAIHPRPNLEVQQGKQDFEKGYYKRAFHELLPYAANGNIKAQYAIGYMYYYGYGVTQDTETGYFWIKKAADQGYRPAIKAVEIIKTSAANSKQHPH